MSYFCQDSRKNLSVGFEPMSKARTVEEKGFFLTIEERFYTKVLRIISSFMNDQTN